jgi:hypothetical protein
MEAGIAVGGAVVRMEVVGHLAIFKNEQRLDGVWQVITDGIRIAYILQLFNSEPDCIFCGFLCCI